MMRNSVVLPQPDGPSKATSSPVGKSSDTSFRAEKLPKFLWIFFTWILILTLVKFWDHLSGRSRRKPGCTVSINVFTSAGWLHAPLFHVRADDAIPVQT